MRFEENGNSVRGMNSDPSIVERVRTNDVAHARNRAARHGWVERDMRELRAEIIVGIHYYWSTKVVRSPGYWGNNCCGRFMRSLVGEEKNMPPRHIANRNELRPSLTVKLTIHYIAVKLREYVLYSRWK